MTAGIDFAYAEERQQKDVSVCGPDPAKHIERRQAFAQAVYNHIAVYQIGRVLAKTFSDFMQQEVLPKFW